MPQTGKCPRCGSPQFSWVSGNTIPDTGMLHCRSCGFIVQLDQHYRVSRDVWESVHGLYVSPPGSKHPKDARLSGVYRIEHPSTGVVGRRYERMAARTPNARGAVTTEQILEQLYELGGYSRRAAIERFNEVKKRG